MKTKLLTIGALSLGLAVTSPFAFGQARSGGAGAGAGVPGTTGAGTGTAAPAAGPAAGAPASGGAAAQPGGIQGGSTQAPGAGGAAAAGTAGGAGAAGGGAAAGAKLSSSDESFVKKAAAGGLAEVQLGKLAQEKGGSQEVKDFGNMMVTDHSKANDELSALASSKGVQLPTDLDAKNKATLDKLSKLSGAEFDKAYGHEMVKDHKEDVSEFEKASKSLKDPELKGFADKTLPVLKTHLEHAHALPGAEKGEKGEGKKEKSEKKGGSEKKGA